LQGTTSRLLEKSLEGQPWKIVSMGIILRRGLLQSSYAPHEPLATPCALLSTKGAVTCSSIPMVDHIVGENPTNVSAAGQLKSLATASTSSLLLRNSKARHNNFLRARFLACCNIFLFLIKRAIISANAFLSLSTFFWYSFWVLSKDVYDKLTHVRLRRVHLEHFKRDLGMAM
jgi:hypothetical protein